MTMKRSVSAAITLGLTATLALAGCTYAVSPMDAGLQYYRSGQYLFAVDAFSQEIGLHPHSAAAYNNRAIAKVRAGELNGAILDYNRAIELAPYDPELYYNRANALVAAGDVTQAITDFSQAVALNPTYAKAYFNRGSARAIAGQRDLAMADWQRAVDLEADPWTKSSMRRSARLETAVAVAPPVIPQGQPTVVGTVAPPPPAGTATDAVPLPRQNQPGVVVTVPGGQPAASVSGPVPPPAGTVDARALAARAITRQLDGDHAGAIQDLSAALAVEPDPARRDAIADLLRFLDRPR
jgi:tetratricopeptide (TPR) repeat protein